MAGNILLNRQLSRGVKVTALILPIENDSIDLYAVDFLHDIYLCPWYAFLIALPVCSILNNAARKAIAGGTSESPRSRLLASTIYFVLWYQVFLAYVFVLHHSLFIKYRSLHSRTKNANFLPLPLPRVL